MMKEFNPVPFAIFAMVITVFNIKIDYFFNWVGKLLGLS